MRDCTIERDNTVLDGVITKLDELGERVKRARVTDSSPRVNQGAPFVRHLENMLVLARVTAKGARGRDESRGAHYKKAFPKRDDERFQRTTLARHKASTSGGADDVEFIRAFDYSSLGTPVHVTDAIDVSLVAPRERKYEQAGAASTAASGAAGEATESKT